VDREWIICPWCRSRLNRVCPNCEKLVGLDWTLCAWCGKDFERPVTADQAVAEVPFVVPLPVPASAGLQERPDGGTITNRKPAIGG
jgi:RNA polymerase subunit RPABC4/transcription elongation factor Spt4